MRTVQMKAEVPRELRRQFLVLLRAREQSFAGWLRDHMVATLKQQFPRLWSYKIHKSSAGITG